MPEPTRAAMDDPDLFTQAGQALFGLGRAFGRATAARQPRDGRGRPIERSRIQVVQAIAAREANPAPGEIGIGTVAHALGIDPSTASRLVAETIRDGYLTRATANGDARRARLELTAAGRALAENASAYQRGVFERLTEGWTDDERARFAAQFIAFAAAVTTLLHEDEPLETPKER